MIAPQRNVIKLSRIIKFPQFGYRYPPATQVFGYSAISIKRTLEKYAYYFRREFHYDFLQYCAETHIHDNDVKAFIFPDPKGKFYWAGGCCFRFRNGQDKNYWALQWIYVFPEYRGQGVVSAAWDTFLDEIPFFIVEEPVSITFQYFLLKKKFEEERVQGGYKISLK